MGFGQKSCCVMFDVPHCTGPTALCGYSLVVNGGNSIFSSIRNTVIGVAAGASIVANAVCNTIVGYCSFRLTTGEANVIIGASICNADLSGSACQNTAIGVLAMNGGLTGSANVLIGAQSGQRLTNNSCDNTYIGYLSGSSASANVQCGNVFIGSQTGCSNVTGILNTIIGAGILCSQITSQTQTLHITAGMTLGVGNCCPTVMLIGNTNGFTIGSAPLSNTGLYVIGCAVASEDVIANYSDRRLKENIIIIDCALDKIKKLNGVSYKVNELGKKHGFENEETQYGLIADEVEAVLPEVVDLAPLRHSSR